MIMQKLSDMDKQMIDYAGDLWLNHTAASHMIRDRFGCSPAAFFQRLHVLIETEPALAYRPGLVNRLRRLANHGRWGLDTWGEIP